MTQTKKKANYKEMIRKYGIIVVILLLCAFFTVLNSVFISTNNIMNIVRSASVNIIMACGATFVIVGGTIDISIAAQACLSGMVTAMMLSNGVGMFPAILCGLLIGVVFGVLNGVLVQKFHLAPMIVTLGTMNLATGIANLLTSGRAIYRLPAEFTLIGRGFVGWIPVPVIIMAAVVLVTSVVLSKTIFGRRTYAIGGNEQVAKLAGINLMFYRIVFYILSGVTAALGGIILASRLASGTPSIDANMTMDILCACVIGGASMDGGKGSIAGSVLGALLLTIISNGMNINGINAYWQMVVSAAILIMVIVINRTKTQK